MDVPDISINGEVLNKAIPVSQAPELRPAKSTIISMISPNENDRDNNQMLVLLPTKTRKLSISGALLTPPVIKENKEMGLLKFLKLSFSGMAVLYGDLLIGPIFLMNQIVHECESMDHFKEAVLASGSMMFYILLLYAFKYCFFVFRVRNMGEGGLLSICESLPKRESSIKGTGLSIKVHQNLVWIALIASAWSITDIFFIPSISAYSVYEGLFHSDSHSTASTFLPKLFAILSVFAIFFNQRYGSKHFSTIFSTVFIVWTMLLFLLGVFNFNLKIFLKIVNPMTMLTLLQLEGLESFLKLWGICFISIAGLSLLYIEISSYKKLPITMTTMFFIVPSLILNFSAQISIILDHKVHSQVFFQLVPEHFKIYLIVFSAIIVLIAANATITAIYNLCDKAITFGALPSLETIHTVHNGHSHIYMDQIIKLIVFASIIAIFLSPSAEYYLEHIGTGMALEIFFTWILVLCSRFYKRKSTFIVYSLFSIIFMTVDIFSLMSQTNKMVNGNIISLIAGLIIVIIFFSWYSTQKFIQYQLSENEWTVSKLRTYCRSLTRFECLGVYFAYAEEEIPFVLKNIVKITKSLPMRVILVNIVSVHTPYVNEEDRIVMRTIDPTLGIYKCTICYGFCELQIPAEKAIEQVRRKAKIDTPDTIYYASNFQFIPKSYLGTKYTDKLKIALHVFRVWIFTQCYDIAGNPVLQYDLPKDELFIINIPFKI